MKKILILLCFLLVSFGYSQKKELRSANKFIERGEYTSALDVLESISDILQTADDKTKARSMFLYGMIYTNTEDFDKAVESYQLAKEIGGSNPLLDAEIAKLENAIITSAIGDQENENFISSAKKLYGAYKINPENNQLYLYYAASSSVSAKDYDQALAYYQMLIDINYEGIETKYYITEVASGNEIEVGSESEFNLLKRTNDYSDPREEDPSNPVLYYNLGVVSADLGEDDAAVEYYKKSIELDPSNEDSYLNMVAVILQGEESIVDEMNSLGTSRSDNIRYDELKKIREDLYLQCVPILKDLVDLNQNIEAVRTLMNIYGTLGDNQGYMEMKNLRDQLDQ